jgi:ABC-type dipeptide/oligopeptide/nickel transport system permease component
VLSLGFLSFKYSRAEKENFYRESVYIVDIGWRKKDTGILRTDDMRVKSAYWKVRFWDHWLANSFIPVLFVAFRIIDGTLFPLPLMFANLGIIIPAIICFVVMRRKRWTDFNKLKDELGIELEQDENVIKEEIWHKQGNSIRLAIMVFSISAVISLITGNFTGIIINTAVIACCVFLIIFLRFKKKA